jgi:hypothetical protein
MNERNRKDETEKQAREDRRRMIAEYDEIEEREAARVKAEVVQALVSSGRGFQLAIFGFRFGSVLTLRQTGKRTAQERYNVAR